MDWEGEPSGSTILSDRPGTMVYYGCTMLSAWMAGSFRYRYPLHRLQHHHHGPFTFNALFPIPRSLFVLCGMPIITRPFHIIFEKLYLTLRGMTQGAWDPKYDTAFLMKLMTSNYDIFQV